MRLRFGQRWRQATGAFLKARQGSVATIFAIAMVPVTLAAGIGLDVSRAMQNRQNLQDALDSTALALAHLPTSTDQATLNAKAQAWLAANLNASNLNSISLTVTPSTSQIVLNATSSVPTTLTAIAGYTTMPINATSTVSWGVGHVEVALVLDNTGSMAQDNKLTNLISSAKTLVTTLLASNTTSDPSAVKISIVPFSNMVNVGSSYQGQSWLDPTANAYDGTAYDIFANNTSAVSRWTLYSNLGVSWAGCVETRPQWVNGVDKSYDITDTAPAASLPGTQFVPSFAPDEPDDQNCGYRGSCSDAYTNNYLPDVTGSSTWTTKQGYLPKYNQVQTGCNKYKGSTCTQPVYGAPSFTHSGNTSMGTGYPYGPNFGCGVQPLQRLTNNATTLNTLLGKMVAAGDTYVPMGLFWGWMTLSPNAPFSDGVAYGAQGVTKVVIVLTDGANNSTYGSNVNGSDNSYYAGVGYQWQHLISQNSGSFSNPTSSMNDREAKICANMKAKGIVIYAVPLEVTDSTAKSLLQNCATDSSHYLNVASSSDLAAAFSSIAGSIGNLRIAH